MLNLNAYENICLGDSVDITIANTDSDDPIEITIEACEGLTLSDSSATIDPCDSFTFTVTFTDVPFGRGKCNIKICGDLMEYIELTWTRVHCALTRQSFILKPSTQTFDDGEFVITTPAADCGPVALGCISEPRQVQIAYTIFDEIKNGDEIYFSMWISSKNINWNFTSVPVAGWKLKMCEDASPGTYDMVFYGVENSNDITHFQQITPVLTFTDTNDFNISLVYNNPADMNEPLNNDQKFVHDFWLKDNLRDEVELELNSGNSVYDQTKEVSFACVIKRKEDNSIQEDFLTLPARMNFYGEGNVVISDLKATITTPVTNEDTLYFSTVRSSIVHLEFDLLNLDTPGTLPDGSVLMLIDSSAANDNKRPSDNYDISQVNLTSASTNGRIINVINEITYSGSGDTFYADIEVDNTCNINHKYRFILITYHIPEDSISCQITEEIEVINIDDSSLDFDNNAETTFITIEKEFLPTETTLLVPVDLLIDTRFKVDLSLLDSQIATKTNNRITTGLEALSSIDLIIYQRNTLNASQDVIVRYTAATLRNLCGALTQDGESTIINNSVGSQIDLQMPLQILNNSLRISGRDNILQTNTGGSVFSTLSAGSLQCVQNLKMNCVGTGLQYYNTVTMEDANFMFAVKYIESLNEFWIADPTSLIDQIRRFDADTLEVKTSIALTAADVPIDIIYIPEMDKAYVSCFNINKVRIIEVSTQTVIGDITLTTATRAFRMCRYNNGVLDYVYVTDATSYVSVIDVSTDTLVTTISCSNALFPTVIPDTDEVWVTQSSSQSIDKIDPTTNTVTGSISSIGFTLNEIIYVPESDTMPARAVIAGVTDIVSIKISDETITNVPAGNQIQHVKYNPTDKTIFFTDYTYDNVYIMSSESMTLIQTLYAAPNSNDLFYEPSNGYLVVVSNTDEQVAVFRTQDCIPELPSYSWAGKDIMLEWRLNFDYGN